MGKARVKPLWTCLLLGALAGCLSLDPSPPPRLLVLADAGELGLPLLTAPGAALSIGLGPVELPEYLRGDSVMARTSPNRIEPLAGERWGEPLEEAVTRVLARDLALALGITSVELHPWYRASAPALQVRVTFWRLEAGAEGQAELLARWQVLDTVAGDVLMELETRSQQPLQGEEGVAAARALSVALAALAREIAQGVRELGGAVGGE